MFYRDILEMSGKVPFCQKSNEFLELFLVIIKPSWSTFVPVSLVCAGHGD